jgi:hypothetical protein
VEYSLWALHTNSVEYSPSCTAGRHPGTQFLSFHRTRPIIYGSHQLTTGPFPNQINPLTPNDHYRGRTAPLNSKRCILYFYSTNIGTEYFEHGIYSPLFLSLPNAVCFIILTYLVPVLFTFYIQVVLKFKKKNPAPKG